MAYFGRSRRCDRSCEGLLVDVLDMARTILMTEAVMKQLCDGVLVNLGWREGHVTQVPE